VRVRECVCERENDRKTEREKGRERGRGAKKPSQTASLKYRRASRISIQNSRAQKTHVQLTRSKTASRLMCVFICVCVCVCVCGCVRVHVCMCVV